MTDGTSDRFNILSIALQLIHGATEGPPGGLGPVFPAGDQPGLADDDARGLGRLFLCPRIRSYFLYRVAGDMAQEEGHGGTLANWAVCRQTGGFAGPGGSYAGLRIEMPLDL